jgi:hypothetical protein
MMLKLKTLIGAVLTLGIVGASAAAVDVDPFRAMLEDSRNQQKGLTFLVSGQLIAGVVLNITDKYVIAKNQAQGNIVIRLDRIDGVTGFVGDKK